MVVRSANSWRLVMDRAYGKVERPDHFKEVGQSFVIRLRDNAHLEKLRSATPSSFRLFDRSGHYVSTRSKQYRSTKHHRVLPHSRMKHMKRVPIWAEIQIDFPDIIKRN